MREDTAAERDPFWDLTGVVRRALCKAILQNSPPDKILLTLATEGSEACDRFEKALLSLGSRVQRKSLLCLKAVCGHVALETIQIVRVGNTDIRLSHFPNAFFFSVLPPRMGSEAEAAQSATSLEPVPINLSPIRTRPDGFPDPTALLELAEGVESGLVETQIPPLCHLEFLSCVFGLPLGNPPVWWAHLGEGRSVWDIEVQDLTVKISIMGEVVRTLAFPNRFHQDFLTRL